MGGIDYYELLGVSRGASTTEIKAAYRALAKVMHPDAGGTTGTFRMLADAYETLVDTRKRAAYDRACDRTPDGARDEGTGMRAAEHRHAGSARTRRSARPTAHKPFGGEHAYVPVAPKLDPRTLGWWYTVDPRQRVRHVPSAAPTGRALLAATGGWLAMLLALVLPGNLPAWLFVTWLLLVVAASGVVARLVKRYLAKRRQDTAFVEEFGGRTEFGAPGGEPDQRAQRLTAELLSGYLTRIPGVRVFHELRWPDSVFTDIDHAVLCGRRLVLVESKLWLPGHYTEDEAGTLWRNGHQFRGGTARLAEALAAYRELLPGVEVRAALLIYPSRMGEITIGDVADVDAPLMSPQRFARETGAWLATDPSTLDRDVFRTVLAQVAG